MLNGPMYTLTTISPISFVGTVQRTPQYVVISCDARMVVHSFVSERQAATVAIHCFVRTHILCGHQLFQENVRKEKNINLS